MVGELPATQRLAACARPCPRSFEIFAYRSTANEPEKTPTLRRPALSLKRGVPLKRPPGCRKNGRVCCRCWYALACSAFAHVSLVQARGCCTTRACKRAVSVFLSFSRVPLRCPCETMCRPAGASESDTRTVARRLAGTRRAHEAAHPTVGERERRVTCGCVSERGCVKVKLVTDRLHTSAYRGRAGGGHDDAARQRVGAVNAAARTVGAHLKRARQITRAHECRHNNADSNL